MPPSASCSAPPRSSIAGGTESMSLVPMTGQKLAPNPTLVDQLSRRLSLDRARRREPRARVGHLARGAGRVRAREPSPRGRRHRRGTVPRRDRAGRVRSSTAGARATPRSRRPAGAAAPASPRRRFDTDEGPRRDTSMEALAKLRPAFHATGSVTAGNSSQTSDGAAAVVVMSATRAQALGLTPLGALRRLRHRRRRARALRHRPGAGDPQGAQADRADARCRSISSS